MRSTTRITPSCRRRWPCSPSFSLASTWPWTCCTRGWIHASPTANEDGTGIVTDKAAAVAVGGRIEATDALGRRPSDLRLTIRGLLRRPPALFGLLCCTGGIIWALMPGLFSPLDPLGQNLQRSPQA